MQTIRTSGPQGTPFIPPVSNPTDINGVLITLDCEVIVNRFRDMASMKRDSWFRAKVVGIGDPGLPGRMILKIRPHGSSYIEAVRPEAVEVHVFDEVAWVEAEGASATHMMAPGYDRPGVDLEKCLFGGFYFEQFQRGAAGVYVGRRVAS